MNGEPDLLCMDEDCMTVMRGIKGYKARDYCDLCAVKHGSTRMKDSKAVETETDEDA